MLSVNNAIDDGDDYDHKDDDNVLDIMFYRGCPADTRTEVLQASFVDNDKGEIS